MVALVSSAATCGHYNGDFFNSPAGRDTPKCGPVGDRAVGDQATYAQGTRVLQAQSPIPIGPFSAFSESAAMCTTVTLVAARRFDFGIQLGASVGWTLSTQRSLLGLLSNLLSLFGTVLLVHDIRQNVKIPPVSAGRCPKQQTVRMTNCIVSDTTF